MHDVLHVNPGLQPTVELTRQRNDRLLDLLISGRLKIRKSITVSILLYTQSCN